MLSLLERGAIRGGTIISNRFGFVPRRDILFLEDIFIEFIRRCEMNGYGKEVADIAKKWTALCFSQFVPPNLRFFPRIIFRTASNMWQRYGFVSNMQIKQLEENRFLITTSRDVLTAKIGTNDCVPAAYAGMLTGVLLKEIRCTHIKLLDEKIFYEYAAKNKIPHIKSKSPDQYNKLNFSKSITGSVLDSMLSTGYLKRKEGQIFYQGMRVVPLENTIEHLLSGSSLPAQEMTSTTYDYLNQKVSINSIPTLMRFLKNSLEAAGVGRVTIISNDKNKITLEISNPPYGLQAEPDNWDFFGRVALGTAWLVNKKLELQRTELKNGRLVIELAA